MNIKVATEDEEQYLSKWVKNEVDEMISRLRVIKSDPDTVVNYYKSNIGKDTPYLAVHNFYKTNVERYMATHHEMPSIIKCEKTSGALMFLDNLQSIAKVFGYVDSTLKELKALALSIIPEIDA